MATRLEMDRLADVQPGAYQAGDDVNFTLARAGNNFLLRFAENPEVFVLYADPASLGGRVLKYDSGEVAMRVAGWGGITLYTDKTPGGLPAVRTGDSATPSEPDISLDDVRNAAADETQHLAYIRRIKINFTTDWDALANDADERTLCFDTLVNTARGLARFAALPQGQQALSSHVGMVLVTTSGKPTLRLSGKQLIVTFNPRKGLAGRASSRAIAHALHTIFHIPPKPE